MRLSRPGGPRVWAQARRGRGPQFVGVGVPAGGTGRGVVCASMAMIGGTITIARAPEDVFAYLDDLGRRPEWQLDITSTRVLTEGPTGVGTEVEETRMMGRRSVTMRWLVTSHDPPRRSAFETYQASMLKPSGVITVEASEGGSRVTFEMEPNPIGFAKLMMPMISRQIRKNVAADLDRLKRNLETS